MQFRVPTPGGWPSSCRKAELELNTRETERSNPFDLFRDCCPPANPRGSLNWRTLSLNQLVCKCNAWSLPSSEGPRNWESSTRDIVVRRKRFGTLPLDDIAPDQRDGQPNGAWADTPVKALYWCDGHRSLAEVIQLTRLEVGSTNFDFVKYFRFLERKGYVEFVKR